MIEDKEQIIYCLETSIDDLKNAIEFSKAQNKDDPKVIYHKLGTVLHWIGASVDRLQALKHQFTVEEQAYVNAFKGACNAQKHSVKLHNFHKFTNGNTYPKKYPYVYGPANYSWKRLDSDVIRDGKQIEKYNLLLKDKEIFEEIDKFSEHIKGIISNY